MVRIWQMEVESKIKPFMAATEALGVAQVKKAAEQYVALVHGQTAVFATICKHKKPANFAWISAKVGEANSAFSLVKQKDFKSPPNHMQTFIDATAMFCFLGFEDVATLKEVITDSCGQVDFYGNKILKLDKELDTKWYNSFRDLNQSMMSFVLQHMPQLVAWPGKEDANGAEAFFHSVLEKAMKGEAPSAGGAPAQATPQAAPAKAAPAQAASVASGNALADRYKAQVMSKMAAVKSAADGLKIAQVSAATDKFLELVSQEQIIFDMQSKFRKPLKFGPLVDKRNKYAEEIGLVKKKDLKAPPHHLQLVLDAFNIFGAMCLQCDDDGKEYYKETHAAIPFPANKILKLDQPNDSIWVNAVLDLCKAHFEFCYNNLKEVVEWKGTAEPPIADLLAKGMPQAAPAQAQAPAPVAKAPAPAKPLAKPAPKKREPS
jgi:hypothetical protein